MKTNSPNPTEHNQWYPFQDRPLPSETLQPAENPSVVPVFEPAPLPDSARFIVIGAGVHGMSTAWHLAMTLEKSGRGKGCLLYTSPSPRDGLLSRMPSSA